MKKRIKKTIRKKKIVKRVISLFLAVLLTLLPLQWNLLYENFKQFRFVFKEQNTHAAAFENGIIIPWPGTAATIPGDWERVTALDDYFVEGTTSDASATPGGADTHSHNSPTHTHTITHGHTGNNTGQADGSPVITRNTANLGSQHQHTHPVTYGNSDVADSDPEAAVLDSSNNDPPYQEVIWITPKVVSGQVDIPDNSYIFWESDTFPSGTWSRAAGNKFLKGAAAASDPGADGGSSDAHSHTDTGHTHTEASHNHTPTIDSNPNEASVNSDTKKTNLDADPHTHTTSGGGVVATETSDNTATVANGDARPPYEKLNILSNDNAADVAAPSDTIALWTSTVASIPDGWVACNGTPTGCNDLNNDFIMGANAGGESGVTTGGGLSHSHGTNNTHTHTVNSHVHTYTVNATATGARGDKLTNSNASPAGHAHSLSVTEGGGSTGTATITSDTSTDETRPPFKEGIFIIYKPVTLTQNDWILYEDNDAENPTAIWGNPDLAENGALLSVPTTNDPVDPADEIRLRMSINVTQAALGASEEGFILQYKEATNCEDATSWTDVDAAAGGGTWRFAASSVGDGTTLTTFKVTASDTYGRYSKADPTSTNPNSVSVNNDFEWDWHVEYNGSATGSSYCFRMIRDDSTDLTGYNADSYPQVETRPGTDQQMRHGNFFTTFVERGFFW